MITQKGPGTAEWTQCQAEARTLLRKVYKLAPRGWTLGAYRRHRRLLAVRMYQNRTRE